MKKQFLILAFSLLCYGTNAQILIPLLFGNKLNQNENIEFGILGGLNFSSISGLEGSKPIMKPNLGIYFDFRMRNPSLYIHTGFFPLSTMGTGNLAVYSTNNANLDEAFVGGSVKKVFNYFSLPLFVKYKFENFIYLEGGPQLGLMYNATDKFSNKVFNSDDVKFFKDVRDQYHKLDAGLTVGLGYRLQRGNGINISARYYWGLVNISADKSAPMQYNRSLYLVVGIPIGAGNTPKETYADPEIVESEMD